jgi:uncharacterized lipoprotein YmbA
MLLTGCQTKINTTVYSISLPDFPSIPVNANKELKTAFNPVCIKTNILIDDLKKYILVYKQNEIENKEKINNLENLISELTIICSPKSRYTKEWLDELYKFKIRYYIYKEGLK